MPIAQRTIGVFPSLSAPHIQGPALFCRPSSHVGHAFSCRLRRHHLKSKDRSPFVLLLSPLAVSLEPGKFSLKVRAHGLLKRVVRLALSPTPDRPWECPGGRRCSCVMHGTWSVYLPATSREGHLIRNTVPQLS
ncbi:hypothetical protein FKP32DRAFT_1468013 [Trametes sanguinea]|nr:hypothetical protein FKP32DRAFT_1468013 [Trametes sanguinea]